MDKNMNSRFAVLVLMAVVSAPVWATTKTVTLDVPGMTCPTCPITIKKALNKVQGVSKVDVNYEKKQTLVTFDDTKTDTKALVKATTNVGYPSQPEGEKK
jgi:periplasmic mercuric ion binding protein